MQYVNRNFYRIESETNCLDRKQSNSASFRNMYAQYLEWRRDRQQTNVKYFSTSRKAKQQFFSSNKKVFVKMNYRLQIFEIGWRSNYKN